MSVLLKEHRHRDSVRVVKLLLLLLIRLLTACGRSGTHILDRLFQVPLNENVEEVELGLVVDLLECVQFRVESSTVRDHTRGGAMLPDSLERPLTINEANVPQLIVLLHADRTTELSEFVFQLKNAVAPVDRKERAEGLAVPIQAVAEPAQTVAYLAVPGALRFPVHFFYVF